MWGVGKYIYVCVCVNFSNINFFKSYINLLIVWVCEIFAITPSNQMIMIKQK